jgi:hypothetical protein
MNKSMIPLEPGRWQFASQQLNGRGLVAGTQQVAVTGANPDRHPVEQAAVVGQEQVGYNPSRDLVRGAGSQVLKPGHIIAAVQEQVEVRIGGRETQVGEDRSCWVVPVQDGEHLALEQGFRHMIQPRTKVRHGERWQGA